MKRVYFGIALLPLAAFGLAACPNFGVDFCEGAACGDVGDGSTSDGPIVPTGCDLTKDPKDSAACVDDTIGIFVSSSGADSNSGTKSSPMKTVSAALGKIDTQHVRVYVCEGTYDESVKVTKAVGIFGGFACADWSYSGKLPKIGPTAPGYALDVESVTGAVTAEDLELDAPNATEPGGSSIAVFVTQSTNVMLKRVTANAGNGADGSDAAATSNYDGGTAPSGNNVQVDAGDFGAPACVNKCIDGTLSIGGAGGNGGPGGGLGGADGGPAIPPNPVGADGLGGGTKPVGCFAGDQGAAAATADGGAGGATAAGSASPVGWTTSAAGGGANGPQAQGGGGGGGATSTNSTGGGGSGGCGGCGGAGGAGGGSGGSTFAVLTFQTTLTVDSCILNAGVAGSGKQGATGQDGQLGGNYGAKISGGNGCDGAPGGKGGAGAGGGGGAGGNAIAIGYVGTKPTVTGGTMSEGNAGAHGAGGAGAAGNDGLPGADGIKADVQELP